MKPKILLCGVELSTDRNLQGLLATKADLNILLDAQELGNRWRAQPYDLTIFEFSEDWQKELQLLQSLLMTQPRPVVIVVDGGANREAVIRSFKVGVKDYFKKAYDPSLLAERVEALLKRVMSEWHKRVEEPK